MTPKEMESLPYGAPIEYLHWGFDEAAWRVRTGTFYSGRRDSDYMWVVFDGEQLLVERLFCRALSTLDLIAKAAKADT
jgi:hypothetical protein